MHALVSALEVERNARLAAIEQSFTARHMPVKFKNLAPVVKTRLD
jgi:hypothetical protein